MFANNMELFLCFLWVKDGLWLELAKLANKNALYLRNQLSQFNDFKILYPTQGNEVFIKKNDL